MEIKEVKKIIRNNKVMLHVSFVDDDGKNKGMSFHGIYWLDMVNGEPRFIKKLKDRKLRVKKNNVNNNKKCTIDVIDSFKGMKI